MPNKLTSRTAISTLKETCPRKWFLNYGWRGRGITEAKKAIPLLVGGCVHKGLENLLLGHDIEDAVKEALALYEIDARDMRVEYEENLEYTYIEQRTLIEALIRAYHCYQLPKLLAEFTVLEVEQEDLWVDFAQGVDLQAKADALLRHNVTGDLHIMSFKTSKKPDKRVQAEAKYDVQGLSELAAIEHRLYAKWKADTLVTVPQDGHTHLISNPPTIEGIKMEYLLKGDRREWPKDSGRYWQENSLIRPWFDGVNFAYSYNWVDSDSKNRKLGKNWSRTPIWQHMEIKDWIAQLTDEQLATNFLTPYSYSRSQIDVDEWVTMASNSIAEAHQYAQMADELEDIGTESSIKTRNLILATKFEKRRRSCMWPTPCSFIPICHQGLTPAEGLDVGIYSWRQAHHDAEEELFAGVEEVE